MGSCISKIRNRQKQSEKEDPDANLDTAINKLEQQEEKLRSDLKQTESEMSRERDIRRKQSLRAKYRQLETHLTRVEKQREMLEEESTHQTLRVARAVSQDTMKETEKAIHKNKLVRQATVQESTM